MPRPDGANSAKITAEKERTLNKFKTSLHRTPISPLADYQKVYEDLKTRLKQKHKVETFEQLPLTRQAQFALSDMTNDFEMKLSDYERYFEFVADECRFNKEVQRKTTIGLKIHEYRKAAEKISELYPALKSKFDKVLKDWQEKDEKLKDLQLKIKNLQTKFENQEAYLKAAMEKKAPEDIVEKIKTCHRDLERNLYLARKDERILKEKLFDLAHLDLSNRLEQTNKIANKKDIPRKELEQSTTELLFEKFYLPAIKQFQERLKSLRNKGITDIETSTLDHLERIIVPDGFKTQLQEDYIIYMLIKIALNNRIKREFELEKTEAYLGACSYNQEILILRDEYNNWVNVALGNTLFNYVIESGSLAYAGYNNVFARTSLDNLEKTNPVPTMDRQKYRETFLKLCCQHPEKVNDLSRRFPHITLDKIKKDILTYKNDIQKINPNLRKPIDEKVYEAAALKRSGKQPQKKTYAPLINKYDRYGKMLKGIRQWLIPEKEVRTEAEIAADNADLKHNKVLSNIFQKNVIKELMAFDRSQLKQEGLAYNKTLKTVPENIATAFTRSKDNWSLRELKGGIQFRRFIEIMNMGNQNDSTLFSIFTEGCRVRGKDRNSFITPSPEKVMTMLWHSYHDKQNLLNKTIKSLKLSTRVKTADIIDRQQLKIQTYPRRKK